MWLGTGKSFGRPGRRKVSTIVIKAILIIVGPLRQTIWSDISEDKKDSTYWGKSLRVHLCWDNFGTSNVPMYVQIGNLRVLCKVSQ